MAKQINVFMENKPGRLQSITKILYENDINIRAMTIQDRGEYGLMKLLVDKPNQAHLALVDSGYASALKDALAILIDDSPGGLYKLATIFLNQGINVLDGYGFVIDSKKSAIWCVEVEEIKQIKEIVEKEGFEVLEDQSLYEL
ncbi:MAG: ACT domain-containing protein [Candidatus Saelkia tenebricola]|nr:ACT domain-containing protein [Candidatus Saelkia tenebricola]